MLATSTSLKGNLQSNRTDLPYTKDLSRHDIGVVGGRVPTHELEGGNIGIDPSRLNQLVHGSASVYGHLRHFT